MFSGQTLFSKLWTLRRSSSNGSQETVRALANGVEIDSLVTLRVKGVPGAMGSVAARANPSPKHDDWESPVTLREKDTGSKSCSLRVVMAKADCSRENAARCSFFFGGPERLELTRDDAKAGAAPKLQSKPPELCEACCRILSVRGNNRTW